MASLRSIALALAVVSPAVSQTLNPITYVGCFSSSSGLTQAGTFQYQSTGHCQQTCVENNNNAPVMGLTQGNMCLCGSSTPPSSAKVDDSQCNSPCTGFGQVTCGGTNAFAVYMTNVGSDGSESSGSSGTTVSSSNAATTAATGTTTGTPQVVTSVAPGKTVVVTEAASSGQSNSPSATNSPSKPHTAAIAAGVVVGIAVLAAIAGGAFFFVRYRRRKAIEEDARTNQVSNFMSGARPAIPAIPAVKRSPSGPDSRFDSEAMAHHRFSDGSIADNEDFSRRILKVTNPDDRA